MPNLLAADLSHFWPTHSASAHTGTNTHTHTHIHTHTHTHTQSRTHTHAHTHACTHAHTHSGTHTFILMYCMNTVQTLHTPNTAASMCNEVNPIIAKQTKSWYMVSRCTSHRKEYAGKSDRAVM